MARTRVEHMVGQHALRQIQSSSDDEMYVAVTRAAMYMATAGFLEEANRLLEHLWWYQRPRDGNCWLADRALTVLWHTANRRPSIIPFTLESIERIEPAHRFYTALDRWTAALPTRPWQQLSGVDLLRRSMHLACPSAESGRMPARAAELEALAGLTKFLDGVEPIGWEVALILPLAAELAARNGLTDQATHFAVRWADGYPTLWLNCLFEATACNLHLAPLLLQRTLAAPLGLDAASCSRYLDDLLLAVDARILGGRILVFGTWSWEHLLQAMRKAVIEAEPDLYTPEELHTAWSGYAPAPEDAIATAEARLQIRLPADYLAFMRTSNGLPLRTTTSPHLLPIEEIDYLRNVADPEIFSITRDYPGDDVQEAMDNGLLVSDHEAEEWVLLIPPLRPDGTWQNWFFAHWVPGEVRYPSFRHYMEHELHSLLESA